MPPLPKGLRLSLLLTLIALPCASWAMPSPGQPHWPWLLALLLLAGAQMGLSFALSLLVWPYRIERRHHYLSLALFCCGLLTALNLGQLLAPDKVAAQAPLNVTLMCMVVLGWVRYQLRQRAWRHLLVDWGLVLQCVLAPLSVSLLSATGTDMPQQSWMTLLTLELAVATVFCLQRKDRMPGPLPLASSKGDSPTKARLEHGIDNLLMGLMLLAWLALSIATWVGHEAVAPARWLLIPALLLAAGLHAIQKLSQVRLQAEQHCHEVERQAQEKMAELERNFNQMAELRVEQVTERERKRIAADLHDDLGAKLLTIVHTSESDRISSLAREALEEMRLSVRGLTGKPVQLIDALGDWRAEVVSRLGQANILAEWKSPTDDISHTLPARAYVQTTRIFREAVSNIIKHSGASQCVIHCSVDACYFAVMIQDNGNGIAADLEGRLDKGHGMASMKSRAKQMQGQCLVESGAGWGTVIRLTIPL